MDEGEMKRMKSEEERRTTEGDRREKSERKEGKGERGRKKESKPNSIQEQENRTDKSK